MQYRFAVNSGTHSIFIEGCATCYGLPSNVSTMGVSPHFYPAKVLFSIHCSAFTALTLMNKDFFNSFLLNPRKYLEAGHVAVSYLFPQL